ncbi:MAG: DUF3299 domain-containing protein [Cyanobacteria bacterium P01_A01_bin.135]
MANPIKADRRAVFSVLAAAKRWGRYLGLLAAGFCLVCGLATAASAQPALTWEDLQPAEAALENPYAHLSTEQTYDLASLERLRAWVAENQAAPDSVEAREIARLEERLRAQNLDLEALLSQVDQAKAYWQHQSRSINSQWVDRTIQLEGYMLPLDLTFAGQAKEFLLVPFVGACIHVPPPPPNQILYIRPARSLELPGLFTKVIVEGELRSQPATYELFQVDGSRPVEVNYALTLDSVSYSNASGTSAAPEQFSGPWWQRLQVRASALLTQAIEGQRQRSPRAFLVGLLVAFSYGVLHTLGPGHGKAIIVAYFVGEGGSLRRGLTMGTRIAVFHVLSAIGVALLVNLVLRQSAPENYRLVKLVSYGVIAMIGVWMLWRAIPRRHLPQPGVDDSSNTGDSLLYPNLTQQVTGAASPTSAEGCACLSCIEPKRASEWLSLAIGSVPCSGALLILLYGSANQLLWPSIAMVVAISVGMAITLAYIGILALAGRNYATRQAGQRLGGRYRGLHQWIRVAGAGSVLLLGVGLFGVTLAAG